MRSLIHFCPFCNDRLEIWHNDYCTMYSCTNIDCINDDMPRYKVIYNNYPTYLTGYVFMLDKYYIQIDYTNQITVISRLEGCMLFNSIQVAAPLSVDFDDLDAFLDKIKTILIFS